MLRAPPATQGNTVQDFVGWARGRDLSYASHAPGASGHAQGRMFSDEARLNGIDTIPQYPGPDAFREDIARALRDWTVLATELNLQVSG